jgi:hypothetical protein
MALCDRCRCRVESAHEWGPWRVEGAYSSAPSIFFEGNYVNARGRCAVLLALLIQRGGKLPVFSVNSLAPVREGTCANVGAQLAYRVRKLVSTATGGAWRLTSVDGGLYRLVLAR